MDFERLRYIYLRRIVGGVLSTLSVRTAERWARRVARAIHALNTPGRQHAERRVCVALGESGPGVRPSKIIASMYEHIARFWVEVLFAPRLLSRSTWRRRVSVHDEPALQSIVESRRGCIFAAAYHGNLYAAAYALGRIFGRIHVVVDVAAHPYLRAWQNDMSRYAWIRMVPRRSAASELPRILSEGGAILMVCEHDRPRGRAVEMEFLGECRRFYPTLGLLACRHDVPVCAITCSRREEAFSFDLETAGMVEPSAVNHEPDEMVRETLRGLEAAILSTPEQYLWSLPIARINRVGRAVGSNRGVVRSRGIGSASSLKTRQRASGRRTPSAAGNKRAVPASEAVLVPKG